MQNRHFRAFVSLAAVSVLLMTYQSHRGPIRPLGFLRIPLNYANYAITYIIDSVGESLRIISRNESELLRLREEVRIMKLRAGRIDEIMKENERLSVALALKEHELRYLTTARVISKGVGKWESSLVIDKGFSDSILKDMPVITEVGLLGKIQEAMSSFSRVLLIDDRRFSAAVRLKDSRTEGVISGVGNGRCELKYIPSDQSVSKGDMLVTSGLDGLFPPGIEVGSVSKVQTNQDELFHRIEVTPYVNPKTSEEVVILGG